MSDIKQPAKPAHQNELCGALLPNVNQLMAFSRTSPDFFNIFFKNPQYFLLVIWNVMSAFTIFYEIS